MRDDLKDIAKQMRADIIEMLAAAGSGHPGGSLSACDILAVLYFDKMNVDPTDVEWPDRDRLVLAKGHAAPALYAALAQRGFFPREDLVTLRKSGSHLQGHPNMNTTPGVEMSTGSLGQGLAAAAGIAKGKKLQGQSERAFALLGDGESEEGEIWESAMWAAHHKLDNLVAMTDWNGQQIDGPTTSVTAVEDLHAKWEAFGWQVIVADGHDFDSIKDAFVQAREQNGKPKMILFRTEMGHGVDFMAGTHKWHGKAPNAEQCEAALAQLKETLGDY